MPHMLLKSYFPARKMWTKQGKFRQNGLLHTNIGLCVTCYIHLLTLENFVVLTCGTCMLSCEVGWEGLSKS